MNNKTRSEYSPVSTTIKFISRRTFAAGAGASVAASSLPGIVSAAVKPHVVVVGGGFGGATCAKYIRLWSNNQIDVTLVDTTSRHVSCVMSNLVLNDRFRYRELVFSLRALANRYGIKFVRARADQIDSQAGQLKLSNGRTLGFDRIVVSTGVRFDPVPGWELEQMPHAWIAGGQTLLLRNKLREMPASGTFVMTVPKAPYRCPPGPYERACLVADYLGRRAGVLGSGRSSGPAPRVIVLDANEGITAERDTFSKAFEGLYGDIIEYYPGIQVEAADAANGALETDMGTFSGDLVNLIPRQRATPFLEQNELLDGGRWAPVDPVTYESTLQGGRGVHIIGDAQATAQPKSGHMANAQAKVCADSVIRSLSGRSSHTAERLANITTNSACYSPITRNKASWLTAAYAYDTAGKQMKLMPGSLGEAGEWTTENYKEMFAWSSNLFADSFSGSSTLDFAAMVSVLNTLLE